jgi:hypothetical protein
MGNIGSAAPWMKRVGAEIEESGLRDRPSSSRRSWFCAGREAAGALDLATGERTERRFVERGFIPGIRSGCSLQWRS